MSTSVLIFYDEPAGLVGDVKRSWDAVREGILDGAGDSGIAVIVASTLPELLAARDRDPDGHSRRARDRGAAAGHRLRRRAGESAGATRRGCARSPPWPVALRPRGPGMVGGSPSTSAKLALREAGIAVVAGRVARDEDDAAAILAELGPPVAAKLSGEGLRHKTELGAARPRSGHRG